MKALITIQNVHSYIEGTFPRDVVDKALAFHTPGFFMSPLFRICQTCNRKINPKTGRCVACGKPRSWDGKKHLLLGGKFGTPYFPTGCLPIVARILTERGVQTIYKDERVRNYTPIVESALNVKLEGRELWQEQRDAIRAALTYERGVIQTPTGGGKTTIMSGICKLLPLNAVVLINNVSIANQLRSEIETLLDEPVGLIKGGSYEFQRVTVAMVQSLCGGLNMDKKSKSSGEPPDPDIIQLVKNAGVVLLDECHHTSSNSWYNLCKEFSNAYFRFGVTGTAFMRPAGDDLLLIGATGGLIYEVSEQTLIQQGKLALPIIHFYKIDEPHNINDKDTYQDVYKQGVVDNAKLNVTAAGIIKNLWKDQQILVLCERLEHIDNLTKLLKGVKYEILTGDSPDEFREAIKEQFSAGKVKVIIATKIFDEGISINNIDVVIRMGLMKTAIKTKQQVGRGQRVKKDKPNVVHIVDFLHTTHKYLSEHSMAHFEMYSKLKYPIKLEQHIPKSISEWDVSGTEASVVGVSDAPESSDMEGGY